MGYLLSLQPTFTQGLVIGQLSILLLVALILKYLFLVNDPSTVPRLPSAAAIPARPSANLKHDAALRDPSSDSTESVDWLNIVLHEVVQAYRSELHDNCDGSDGDEAARAKVENQLNSIRPAGFMDPIVVHSVDLGTSAPRLSNARLNISTATQQQVEFDMTYRDSASISLSTSVLFNYPLPLFARLPVSLTLSVSLFASKILLTPPCPSSSSPKLTLALPPQFTLDLHISSLLGSRAKLADVPKLHEMIESYIKKTLADRGVWNIVLPGVVRVQGGTDAHSADEVDVKLVNDKLGMLSGDLEI